MVLDFSRNYSPPGVYIEEADSTFVSSTGVPPTIVALVGPARGYQIATEQVVLSETAQSLSKQGVDLTSVKVSVASTGVVLDADEFAVTKGAGTGQDYLTTFEITAETSVEVGTPVFVTYRFTAPDYFDPKSVDNFEDVKDYFGEPLNLAAPVTGETYQPIASPLSLAAMIAIQNGATDLVLCAATAPPAEATTEAAKSSARAAALKAAYVKVEADPSINVIVPITAGIADSDTVTTVTDLHAHLTSTYNEGLPRFGVLGFDPGMATAPDTLLASSMTTRRPADRRIMLAYSAPGGLNMYSGQNNSAFAVGHTYLAAAYAGRMQALPLQQSLTKQTIIGFTGIAGTPLSNSLKNQYSASGVAVTEQDRFGRLTVRHGVTTDPTNVNTREASVVRARDGLVRALAEGTTGSGLIGAPIDEDLLLSVKSTVQGVLESAVSDEVIVSYTGLTLRQLAGDPSVVEIKFAYRPAYPLNYIVISFSIDTTNGTIADTAAADEFVG